jgi:hypothetical protein
LKSAIGGAQARQEQVEMALWVGLRRVRLSRGRELEDAAAALWNAGIASTD